MRTPGSKQILLWFTLVLICWDLTRFGSAEFQVKLGIIYVAGHFGSNSDSNRVLADFGIVSQFQFAFVE
jgi:hypothetical protein